MSKVIFGFADVDNGVLICEGEDEDSHEVQIMLNVFGDGVHAVTIMNVRELTDLHVGLSRYLGVPYLTTEEDDGDG